jgi:hypothetical protein
MKARGGAARRAGRREPAPVPPEATEAEARRLNARTLAARHATSIHDTARLRVLEAYIETLKAENESLKRSQVRAKAGFLILRQLGLGPLR